MLNSTYINNSRSTIFARATNPWVFAIFFFASSICFSQDTAKVECGDIITFKNETTQKAKIYEITPNEVVFKRCANLNGPIIRISKSNIKSIAYLNGTKESFEKYTPVVEEYQPPVKATVAEEPVSLQAMKKMWLDTNYYQNKVYAFDHTKHFISTDVFNLIFFGLPSLSYERFLMKGKLGVRGIVAMGFREAGGGRNIPYMKKNTKNSFGLDVNYYLHEGNFYPGPVKPFLGLSFDYGVFTYCAEIIEKGKADSIFVGTPPVFSYIDQKYNYFYYNRTGYSFTYMLKGGLLFRPGEHFNISLVTGIGGIFFNKEYTRQNQVVVKAEINLGYKF